MNNPTVLLAALVLGAGAGAVSATLLGRPATAADQPAHDAAGVTDELAELRRANAALATRVDPSSRSEHSATTTRRHRR